MVTVPEYQKSLQERRQQLEQVQQKVQSQTLQFSQRQLRGTPMIERQKAVQKFGGEKAIALKSVGEEFAKQEKMEKELVPKLEEYSQYQAAVKKSEEYKQGYEMGLNKVFPMFTSDVMKQGYKDAVASLGVYRANVKYVEDVAKFKEEVTKAEKEFAEQNLKILYDPTTSEYQGYTIDVPPTQVTSPVLTPSYVEPKGWKEKLQAFPSWAMVTIVEPTIKGSEWVLKKIPEIPIAYPTLKMGGASSFFPVVPTFKLGKIGDIPMAMPTKEGFLVGATALFERTPFKFLLPATTKQVIEVTKDKPKMELTTLSGGLERVQSALDFVGETAGEGWQDIIKKTRLENFVVPFYVPSSLLKLPHSLIPTGFTKIKAIKPFTALPSIAKASPEFIGYLGLGVVPMATLSVVAEAERIRTVDKRVQEELKKQYLEGIKTLEIPEGYRVPTFEEYKVEAEPIIKESLIRQSAIKGGIAMAFLAGAGITAGYKALTKPIYSKPFTPKFGAKKGIFEVHYPGEKASYQMYQYRPPQIVATTTKFRQFFGMGPKEIKIVSKAQLYVTEPFAKTLVSLKQGKTYIAQFGKVKNIPAFGFRTGKELSKYVAYGQTGKLKLFKVGGIGEEVSPEGFASLTKQEKYVLKSLYGKQPVIMIKPGEKIDLKSLYGRQPVTVIKPGELYVGKTVSYQLPAKPPKLVYSFTKMKELTKWSPDWYARTEPPTFIGTKTAFKDITKGMYRASGKIEKWKGIIIKTTAEPPPQSAILKIKIPKTAYKVPEDILKLASPQVSVKSLFKNVFSMGKKGSTTIFPQVIPRTILKVSVPKIIVSPPLQTIKAITIIKPSTQQFERLVGLSALLPRETQKVKLSLIEVPKPTQQEEEIVKEIPDVIGKVIPTTKTEVIQKPIVISPLEPIIEPSVSKPPIQIVIPRQKLKPIEVKPKIKITPELPERKPIKRISPLIIKQKASLFTPYVRRYRTWSPVSKPVSKKQAVEIGVKKLRTTLAASLMIKKGGEAVPFMTPQKPMEFRLAKGGLILIQKAPRRLKARTEVAEIIRSRRGRRPLKFL
jgi:hypothetical protein